MMTADFRFSQKLDSTTDAVYRGPFPFDKARLAVFLNSRQTKTPSSQDGWVKTTQLAAQYAAQKGLTVLTSIGLNIWEFDVYACAKNGCPQVIICPASSEDEMPEIAKLITADFDLNPQLVGWLFYGARPKSRSAKADWPLRDRLAIQTAEIIIPVCLRKSGNLENLLKSAQGKTVITDFLTEYAEVSQSPEPGLSEQGISTRFAHLEWDHICHWTHTCHGPWPAQSRAEYYQGITDTKSYPNDGYSTLMRILRERKIRGSAQQIRTREKVVAFSNLHPAEVLPMFTWRKRFVRFNFEPYGIAIRRNMAARLGARPVIYGKPSLYNRLTDEDKPFFQNEGTRGDWRPEREWRHFGDFEFGGIDPNDLIIFTRSAAEIPLIGQAEQANILSFLD